MSIVFSRSLFMSVLPLVVLCGCAPATQGPQIMTEDAKREAALQREMAMDAQVKHIQYLQDVSMPILVKNAEMCDDQVAAYSGALTLSLDTVEKEYKETMETKYNISAWPTVILIAKNAPAYRALQAGDIIKSVNGQNISKGKAGYDQMQKALAEVKDTAEVEYVVERGGELYSVPIKTVMACDYPVQYQNSDTVNAAADGKYIYVSKGIIRFTESDEELALVIGHELAHNTREHSKAKRGNAIVGGIFGAVITVATGVDVTGLGADLGAMAHSQGFEEEADYVGMYHTARAGYKVDKAPQMWRRMAAENPQAIHLAGTTHPSTAKRFLSLEATAKEIAQKKAKGQPLFPEEREVESYQNDGPAGLND